MACFISQAFQLLPWYLGRITFSVSDNVRRPNDRAPDWTSRLGQVRAGGATCEWDGHAILALTGHVRSEVTDSSGFSSKTLIHQEPLMAPQYLGVS